MPTISYNPTTPSRRFITGSDFSDLSKKRPEKALVEANRASFTIKSRKGEGTMVEVSFPQTRVLAE